MAHLAQSQKSSSPSQSSEKGEVSDVKMQLWKLAGSRAPGTDDAKRELFKKVISYMTIGIDVSSVFSEMVMCSATTDIMLKKEFVFASCRKFGGVLGGPLGNGLKDGSSYVRMVATVGVLKLYHISASTCIDADFPAMLKHLMLNDKDARVVANCLTSLQEIWGLEASTSVEVERERERT